MSDAKPNRLERRVGKLELKVLDTMRSSVEDFYRRVPSGPKSDPKWTPEMYPNGTEKELYPQIAHILLSAPEVYIPTLLDLLGAPAAQELLETDLSGQWKAYRMSTVRLEKPVRWTDPMCFPGGAGEGGIADVGLFLNPTFDGKGGKQLRAERIVYFEIKSADRYSYQQSQLLSHLSALEEQTEEGVGFLAAIGGRFVAIEHPRWLGHVSLTQFLSTTARAARSEPEDEDLATEVERLLKSKSS
jgi:hypothetical protein